MALFVQLPGKGGETHHRVASYSDTSTEIDPMYSLRAYVTGCGRKVDGWAHRMAEADAEPTVQRCTKAGCFLTAESKET